MSSFSNKSAQEISDLLDDYGIKHGPVVDSTRGLYEKKLREAMAKGKRANVKPSSDITYYREEEEEVTYVTYRSPIRNDGLGDRTAYMRSRPEYAEREYEDETLYSRSRPEYSARDFVDEPHMYDTPSTYRNVTYATPPQPVKSARGGPKETPSSRLIPLWLQFLVFLAVAGFLYFVFSNMESTYSEPFKKLE